eukprot:scaffold302535_cov24-Tisochrysis_lutea.AAC.1
MFFFSFSLRPLSPTSLFGRQAKVSCKKQKVFSGPGPKMLLGTWFCERNGRAPPGASSSCSTYCLLARLLFSSCFHLSRPPSDAVTYATELNKKLP